MVSTVEQADGMERHRRTALRPIYRGTGASWRISFSALSSSQKSVGILSWRTVASAHMLFWMRAFDEFVDRHNPDMASLPYLHYSWSMAASLAFGAIVG